MEFQCRSGRLVAVRAQGESIYTASLVLFGLIRSEKQKPERKMFCVYNSIYSTSLKIKTQSKTVVLEAVMQLEPT